MAAYLRTLLVCMVLLGGSWAADVTPGPQGVKSNATGGSAHPQSHPHGNRSPPVPRSGVFPPPGAAGTVGEAAHASEHEYYSYEYSDEPLSSDTNGSGKREGVSWLVPDPEQLAAAERAAEERAAAAAARREDQTPEGEEDNIEDELPDNSLADGDLHDHDMMDSVMYIYFGPNPRSEGGATAQVVLAGAAVGLFAQALTALGAVRKALRSKCRRNGAGGSPGVAASTGSLQAAMVLLHTEIALATASLVFIFAVHGTGEPARCQAVALLLHFLHLGAACWIAANCARVFLWLSHEVTPASAPPSRLSPNLQALAIAAWALPLLLVLVSFVAHPQGYESRHYCWLSVHKGMLVSFLTPVAALIAGTTALAVLGVRRAPHKLHSSAAEDAARLSLRLGATALPLFAVSWFFSVLALEQPQSLAAALLFAATSAIFNWFVFACSGSLFPECPVSPARYTHPLALHPGSGPHFPLAGPHPGLSAPPSPSQHDAQPLLPASGRQESARPWSHGWTPSSHPELPPSPAQRCRVSAWHESEGLEEVEGSAAASSLGASAAAEDDLEAGETSGLLELRLEHISTITT